MTHAVIDRFEGTVAVLVFDDGQQVDISRDLLPSRAKEGHHLSVTIEQGEITQIEVDHLATDEARRRIEDKLNKLRRGDHLAKDD